ncbi:TlpA family protein disulfide reductase [Salinimicrobium terrae]|uniref:TlpA family protein disulfide reductase n=1 Tax=Salinimicrobium terrae TaxID=470866 RepID=UPI00041D0A02|nr:redoxin domain-containing protein [Salinimicrobium terrae]
MQKFLLLILPFTFLFPSYAQEDQITFSEALTIHLPKYKKHADKAYRSKDVERANFLFDSLIDYNLKGSRMDNFKVNDLRKKSVHLNEFEKPVYLTTYASWIVPTEGEIPALNELAEKYGEQVDFVMLFWDNHSTTKRLAKKYSENITVLYVDEMNNNSPYVIKMMKHSLGLPTSFLLDRDKNILDIRRKVSHPFGIEFEKSFDLNYDSLSSALFLLLIEDSSQYSTAEENTTP